MPPPSLQMHTHCHCCWLQWQQLYCRQEVSWGRFGNQRQRPWTPSYLCTGAKQGWNCPFAPGFLVSQMGFNGFLGLPRISRGLVTKAGDTSLHTCRKGPGVHTLQTWIQARDYWDKNRSCLYIVYYGVLLENYLCLCSQES